MIGVNSIDWAVRLVSVVLSFLSDFNHVYMQSPVFNHSTSSPAELLIMCVCSLLCLTTVHQVQRSC